MAKRKVVGASKPKAEPKVAAKATPKAAKKAKGVTSATVVWDAGTRAYSQEVHGDDFLSLAELFASKVGGVVE